LAKKPVVEARDSLEMDGDRLWLHCTANLPKLRCSQRESIQDVAKINQLLLIVVDMEREEILQWIN